MCSIQNSYCIPFSPKCCDGPVLFMTRHGSARANDKRGSAVGKPPQIREVTLLDVTVSTPSHVDRKRSVFPLQKPPHPLGLSVQPRAHGHEGCWLPVVPRDGRGSGLRPRVDYLQDPVALVGHHNQAPCTFQPVTSMPDAISSQELGTHRQALALLLRRLQPSEGGARNSENDPVLHGYVIVRTYAGPSQGRGRRSGNCGSSRFHTSKQQAGKHFQGAAVLCSLERCFLTGKEQSLSLSSQGPEESGTLLTLKIPRRTHTSLKGPRSSLCVH